MSNGAIKVPGIVCRKANYIVEGVGNGEIVINQEDKFPMFGDFHPVDPNLDWSLISESDLRKAGYTQTTVGDVITWENNIGIITPQIFQQI